MMDVAPIPPADLRPHPSNARRHYDEQALADLAASIAEHGVLQPLTVRPARHSWIVQAGRSGDESGFLVVDTTLFDGPQYRGEPMFFGAKGRRLEEAEAEARAALPALVPYEIVFGHRRWRAAKMAAKMTSRRDSRTIPCFIRDLSDEEAAVFQLLENDQRADLLPSERSAEYRRMIQEHRYTLEKLGQRIGRPLSHVRTVLAMGKVPAGLMAAVDKGVASVSAAEAVARIPEAKARDLAARCVLAGCPEPGALGLYEANAGEPLNMRATRELVSLHFQRQLKGAPFDPEDADLLPSAGPCTLCPKRAGVLAKEDEAYRDTRPDVCLDTECYRRKERASKGRVPLPVVESVGPDVVVPAPLHRVLVTVAAQTIDLEVRGEPSEAAVRRAVMAKMELTWEPA